MAVKNSDCNLNWSFKGAGNRGKDGKMATSDKMYNEEIMTNKSLSGLYLVIDPSVEQNMLLEKVHEALEGGVEILQVWNNWPKEWGPDEKEKLITAVLDLARGYQAPILINDEWELLKTLPLDGVHFDAVPNDFNQIKEDIGRYFIAGLTCGNDLEIIRWADKNGFNYVSFCAMFPSPSAGSCEIVSPETVKKARKITDLPLFLSGGITPEKIGELNDLEFNGVAVISGILNAERPDEKTQNYKKALRND